ncbi:unnamed protein product [Caenorhabditis brenneri]
MRRSSGNSPFPSIPVLSDSNEKEEEELGSEDVTTRSGPLSMKRASDMHSLHSQIPTSPICETPESSERNTEICEFSSSRRTRASPDYNPNQSIEDSSRAESIQEDLNVIEREDDIQQIQRPSEELQALDEHNQIEEVPIKMEHEEPAEVKPETSHNSKIKFFEAMKSLILFLDTPSLSNLQSKIHQKIRKLKGSKEVFHNNELIPAMDFMIAKIINHSAANLPKTVESVSLSHFLCLLKAAILNSKLAGLDLLLERIRELNKEQPLQIKNVPVKTLHMFFKQPWIILDFNYFVMNKLDSNCIDLLNYLIKRTENVESPMRIKQMGIEFKEKSGAAQPVNSLITRIKSVRTRIHSFEHIDTTTKVKLIFALSASVDANVLRRLKKEALVEVDDKKRITHYKAKDGSLELRGDHSRSAKNKTAQLESKRSHRSMINNYFETKDDADAIPQNKKEKEIRNLIEFITEKCVNVDTPLNIFKLAKDFKNRFGISILLDTIRNRVKGYSCEIQKVECLNTNTKVQQLFGLSATVDSDCLKELRKDAIVEIDEKNRITYYKATNGSLELRGDHHRSAKIKTAMLESKGSIRSMIHSYFENKNDADAVPNNKKESEMWQLIEFFTEKCQPVDAPLNIHQLTKHFNQGFESSVPFETVRKRIRRYGREIQRMESLDTLTKVKQLFCLSTTVDSEYLEELRKDAVVDVDNRNRITKYTANNGSLTLHGEHSSSAKRKLSWIARKKKRNIVEKHSNSGEDDSDEYSSEEFGSEFDSDDENDSLDESDHMDSSNKVLDFGNKSPIRNRSPTEMSIDDNFNFEPLSEKSHRSEETERGEDEDNDLGITGHAPVKTRSERLSKRRHLDPEVSYNQANSSSSEIPMTTNLLSPKSAKQKKSIIQMEQAPESSNQSRSSSRSMRRSSRNSSFPSTSTDPGEKMENQDAHKAVDFDNESSIRDGSPAEMPMDDNFDFDPPSERPHTPEETQLREDDDNDPGSTENAVGMTKSERLCKRKHLDSNFSNNLANSSGSGSSTNTNSIHSKPSKQKKIAIEKEQASISSNESRDPSRSMRRSSGNSPFPSISVLLDSDEKEEEELGSEDVTTRSGPLSEKRTADMSSLRIQIPTSPICETPESFERNVEIYESSSRTRASPDFNPNHSIDDPSRAEFIQEDNNVIEGEGDIQQIPEPPQALSEHNPIIEVPIKVEQEEHVEVKPETSHNSKIKFFEAMESLILFLDTPFLSNLQTKIHQKIRKLKGSKEVFHNNELIPAMEFMIAKLTNHSTANLPKTVESVSLSHFLCLLKAAILNSKLSGLDSLLDRIRELNKEQPLQTKSVPVKTLAHVLQTTMDNIGF